MIVCTFIHIVLQMSVSVTLIILMKLRRFCPLTRDLSAALVSPLPNALGFTIYISCIFLVDYPRNYRRERVNEGAFQTPDQELIYEGPSARQSCPQMVGPFADGNYYCTAKEYGYCDRRSGTCFCHVGYEGVDCSNCQSTHYRVGYLCYPKILCPDDCNAAGVCNYNNGTCNCFPHRIGSSCETILCSIHDEYCESCTVNECLRCFGGFYLTGKHSSVCGSCYDFDPRCAGCTKEDGCTVCADPVLTSVHRSGYRSIGIDLSLPVIKNDNELTFI